jgi:glycolate oxidase FAD binding subunit
MESRDIHAVAAGICGTEFAALGAEDATGQPRDLEQAAELLRLAHAEDVPVTIEGSGSKQGWLNPARRGLRLDTRRMNQVLEHTWQDMTCTVQAGCTWEAMQKALGKHGQFVALDPLWPERATVGGVVAANDSGTLRLRYGGLRDLLIGMTVVMADGTVARSGGKVVKNVAGYDLPKLLCGSFGTLALIAEVTFRLHSVPPHSVQFIVHASTAEPLGRLMLKLLDSQMSLRSLQMRSEDGGFALDICLSALPEAVQDQRGELERVCGSVGLAVREGTDELWSARERLFEVMGSHILFKASVLPDRIAGHLESVRELNGTSVAQATGLLHGAVPYAASEGLMRLRAGMEEERGSLVLLNVPSGHNLNRWGAKPSSLPLMRSIKYKFDPRQILNPARFLGDI